MEFMVVEGGSYESAEPLKSPASKYRPTGMMQWSGGV